MFLVFWVLLSFDRWVQHTWQHLLMALGALSHLWLGHSWPHPSTGLACVCNTYPSQVLSSCGAVLSATSPSPSVLLTSSHSILSPSHPSVWFASVLIDVTIYETVEFYVCTIIKLFCVAKTSHRL